MSAPMDEGRVRLHRAPGWQDVKLDEHPVFMALPLPHLKAVDRVLVHSDRVVLLEVTDYREMRARRERDAAPSVEDLAQEMVGKLLGSLLVLLCIRRWSESRSDLEVPRAAFEWIQRSEPIVFVIWLEGFERLSSRIHTHRTFLDLIKEKLPQPIGARVRLLSHVAFKSLSSADRVELGIADIELS
jgi:hypothetical protein